MPDSIAFRGQSRLTDDQLRAGAGIAPKARVSFPALSRAIRDLYATNQFESDIRTSCETINGKAVLIFNLKERRILSDVRVEGADRVSPGDVRDRVDILVGKPIDPAQVAKDVARIDSLYQSESYYLAKVTVDTIIDKEATTLVFKIDEGRHLAISGITILGNKALTNRQIVAAIGTKPEGFFWWRNGEFDSDK
ncbi:MAG TPA: POTRA domain-containing protein, partial [Gemmatimonadaceae bacterium]|nr:POTRA domain-containing protein [Gemmatimonadaceae bacterium]